MIKKAFARLIPMVGSLPPIKQHLFRKYGIEISNGNEIYSHKKLTGISDNPEFFALCMCLSEYRIVQLLVI